MGVRQTWANIRVHLLGAAAIGLAVTGCVSKRGVQVPPGASGPSMVTGTLVARTAGAEIELADVRVHLADSQGRRVAEAVTALDGRFDLVAPTPGPYRLCYVLASGSRCAPQVVAQAATTPLGSIAVQEAPSLSGRVLTGDGRPCWISDSFFGLDVSTQIIATPRGLRGGLPASARANTEGEYAMFELPGGQYDVATQCEAARATRQVRIATGTTADFDLRNRAPVIHALTAFEGAAAVTQALTGRTLDLRAETSDPEGDQIRYGWSALPASGQLTPGGGATAQWRMPAEAGLISAYLIARDGKGGYAFKRVDMSAAPRIGIVMSGRALDETTGRGIENATVTMGSASTLTGTEGRFSLEGAPRDDGRYVLTLDHPDYALMSRVLDRGVRGVAFEMTAAQVTQMASAEALTLVDRSSAGYCGTLRGPAGEYRRPVVRRERDREDKQLERPRDEAPCVRRGAEIAIPAGALVDGRGNAAAGPVRAAVTTLNPERRALPGDYSALTRTGETVGLVSYGAVDAKFTDAAGQPLNLRPGATAEVRIPVPPGQAATARPTMPMWSYDAARGRWIEEGSGTLERRPDGLFYVGRTRHFSTINFDLPGYDLSNVTCLRAELDNDVSAWTNKILRVYVSYGGTSLEVREQPLDSAPLHAIYTIPWGSPPTTARLELRGELGGTEYVLFDQIYNLDTRPKMTGTDIFPPYPYTACGDVIHIGPAPLIPYYGLDASGRPAFLTGPFGGFNPPGNPAAAYYQKIDPNSERTELDAWWQKNGFQFFNGGPGTGTGYIHTHYMNDNDLGFGRAMTCHIPAAGKLACYVTNFGLPDRNPANAVAAAVGDQTQRGGTVAMEYDPSLGANAVSFYAFGGGGGLGPRLDYVDLDGFGPKPVPYVCMVCHGGNFANDEVEHARFREFDLTSFVFPPSTFGGVPRTWDYGGTTLFAAEKSDYSTLNRLVRDVQPSTSSPIHELIDKWYPNGVGVFNPAQPAVPAGWVGHETEYDKVYARSCRTCHIARDGGQAAAPLVFDSFAQFVGSSAASAVCGYNILPSPHKRRRMPNAAVTYRNFWANATRVQLFETMMSIPANTCGQ